MDFVSDALATGRALRTFTLIDSYTKESLAIEVNTGISSRQVTRVLERVIEERGAPGGIRCDNGPEFTSLYFVEWCRDRGITLLHIQPGKPVQNGHVESFNGRFRDECLNPNWFVNLADARRKIEAWRKEYTGSVRTAVWRIGRRTSSPESAQNSPAGWAPVVSKYRNPGFIMRLEHNN